MNRISMAFVLALVGTLGGCATTGYRHASETSSAISGAKTLTVKIQQSIDTAVTNLQSLTSQEGIDLRQPYERLSASVNTLDAQAANLTDQARVIKARGKAYTKDWQQELGSYQSSAIRVRSAERLNQVTADFQKVSQQFEATGQSLRLLVANLKDVRLYLKTDLTSAGVTSIQDQLGDITNQATLAQQTLHSLLAELNRVGRELSPVTQVVEQPGPGTSQPSPSVEQPSQSAGQSNPSAEQPSPSK
jgi:ribosomal protein S15P/S13E